MSIFNKLKKMVGSPAEKAKSEPIKETTISQTPVLKIPIEWVDIPAGTFEMGSPKSEVSRKDNEIQHKVTLSGFRMSKHQITFKQYNAYCEAERLSSPFVELELDMAIDGNRPITHVSWGDATNFANWLGCRLPTEAEWEYACRAGTTTPFSTGKNLTISQANYKGTAPYNDNEKGEDRQKTIPVGSFAPNPWGLYDMHGNVFEWCRDYYGNYATNDQTNPIGAESGEYRIIRGGSWDSSAQFCRSAYRSNRWDCNAGDSVGFRLVYQT